MAGPPVAAPAPAVAAPAAFVDGPPAVVPRLDAAEPRAVARAVLAAPAPPVQLVYAPHGGAGAGHVGGGDAGAHAHPNPIRTGLRTLALPTGAPFRTTFANPESFLKYFGYTDPTLVKAHKFDDDMKPMPETVYTETVHRQDHGPDNYFYFTSADGKLHCFVFRSVKECVRFKKRVFARLPSLCGNAVEVALSDERVTFDWKRCTCLTTLKAMVANLERLDEDVYQARMEETLQEAMEDIYEDMMGRPAKKPRQE